jgi:MFS family permease
VSDTTTPAQPKTRLGRSYWRLWIASVISNLGDGIGIIAYPWLASAVTRNPLLIALIAVAQRLPWLLFTLPAGVITDRVDRRKIMVGSDVLRAVLTAGVAFVVLGNEGRLPAPADVASGTAVDTNLAVYVVLVVAALLIGMAEVLRDNAAQTFLPAIVEPGQLEKANGNLWGAEMVANSFAGPPLGSLLLGVGFALPFFVDAGTFAVAAGLVFLIAGQFKPAKGAAPTGRVNWKGEMKEGFLWLWRHDLLRPLAIVLGLLNGLGMMIWSTFILFAQEDLDLETGLFTGVLGSAADFLGFESVGAFIFAVLMMAGALGGVLGSVFAARLSRALGSGPSLYATLLAGTVGPVVIGLASWWWVAFVMQIVMVFFAVLWNVITVSLRQTIIPDHLLGRANSVYRFFGWGMMPIGSFLGGAVVAVGVLFVDREMALRLPFFVVAAAHVPLLAYAAPRLTSARIDGARAAALAERSVTDDDAREGLAEMDPVAGIPEDED